MKFSFLELLSQLSLVICWCWCLSITFISQQYGCAVSLPNNETSPAVIVLGDSIVDMGNNNYINTIIKGNFPPYGREFAGGNQPNGRFSNGLVPSDIIAAKFGVKKLLPAYLDPNLQLQDLPTGVSFASGGAGYDTFTSELAVDNYPEILHAHDFHNGWSVTSLSDQLDMFKEYKTRIKEAVGKTRMATIMSKSIYIVCMGSNDIAITYAQKPIRYILLNNQKPKPESSHAEYPSELYGLGARKIGVIGLQPVGCLPSQRTIAGGIQRACSDFENQAAILFNIKLVHKVDALKIQFPGATLLYLDIYNPLMCMIRNPDIYGFEVTDRGCCGTGNIEVSILCNSYSPNTCPNSSSYIFWDSLHPTEKAYNVLCSILLEQNQGLLLRAVSVSFSTATSYVVLLSTVFLLVHQRSHLKF